MRSSSPPFSLIGRAAGRSGLLVAGPIAGVGREDALTAGRLGRAVERVGGGAPDGIMRRGPVRLQRRLVAVYFIEIIDVGVLPVVQHVEAQAARLVPFGA